VAADQIAQRPLQEQECNQRQCKPLGGGHQGADQAIEPAQEHRQVAISLVQFQAKRIAGLEGRLQVDGEGRGCSGQARP
jgi:hypothetical protein